LLAGGVQIRFEPADTCPEVSEATVIQGAHGDETGLIEEARERRVRPMTASELTWGIGRAALFLTAAVVIAVAWKSGTPLEWDLLIMLAAAYAVLWNVELEIGLGATVPVLLATVPMLFLLPTELVPLVCVAAALVQESRTRAGWVRRALGTTYSHVCLLGPVVVLLATGTQVASWSHWYVYVLALTSFVLLDVANTVVQMRVVLHKPVGARDFAVGIAADLVFAPIAFLGVICSADFRYAFLIPMLLALASAALTRERRVRVDKASELSHAYRGTALLLGSVIDADDGYTGYHSRGVVELAVAVADQLGLDDRQRQLTEFAALLHDVGKIKVPKEIINKPGPLTPDEWDVVRRHPGDGADMLNGVGGFLAEVGDIVRHHHERWDGDGYPENLAGEDIPVIARIVAACDAFSAITTDRAYRRGRPIAEALEELRRSAGTQFDPAVIDALCKVMGREDVARALNAA
jgi:putative nucleotidyltransferase with HDIG domain